MKRRYGDAKTQLILSDKAFRFYSGSDPIDIYEIEDEDGSCTYTLRMFGDPESKPMGADELTSTLESLADEFAIYDEV